MAASPVLIITENSDLLDDLLRLCTAVDAAVQVVHGGPVPAASWEHAPLVLAGDDWAASRTASSPALPRRTGVVLVGTDSADLGVWPRGVALGVEQVLHLPDHEQLLAGRIADAVEGGGRPALTVGLLGGRGGSGASTLACGLALAAARAGHRTLLVDGDPLGGGLDVAFGAERDTGPRWPAFAGARGRLSGTALTEALPRPQGVSLLSWDRSSATPPDGEAMSAVLSAAARRGGLVFVDLPRTVDDATVHALSRLDLGLLTVPAQLRAVAAARRMVDTAGAHVRDLRVVARTAPGSSLAAEELAGLLGLPLAGELPDEPASSVGDGGRPPGSDPEGLLARFSGGLLDRVLVTHAPVPEGVA